MRPWSTLSRPHYRDTSTTSGKRGTKGTCYGQCALRHSTAAVGHVLASRRIQRANVVLVGYARRRGGDRAIHGHLTSV